MRKSLFYQRTCRTSTPYSLLLVSWATKVCRYEDKYLLAETLVNSGLNALVQVFEALGFSDSEWKKVHSWNRTRSVTLRLKAEEKCKFSRKAEREVKSDTTHVTQSTLFGTSKSYTVTKVRTFSLLSPYSFCLLNTRCSLGHRVVLGV
jgi:hypothetical protein